MPETTNAAISETAYDSQVYCPFPDSIAKAGQDIILCIYNTDGSKLLAVAGQQGLTINRSAETVDVSSKDLANGWKAQIAGAKEWSIDNDGIYIISAESHKLLGSYFKNGDLVCLKIVDKKENYKPLLTTIVATGTDTWFYGGIWSSDNETWYPMNYVFRKEKYIANYDLFIKYGLIYKKSNFRLTKT